ncbi:MAG: hypothetical protein ABR923_10635 [Terracidiphilus sp.]|jgi:hypothetical protein
MRSLSRFKILLASSVLLAVSTVPACASGLDDKTPDQQTIDALEARALQAQPREQCFIYTQLIHEMTELSLRTYAAGDIQKATSLLKKVQLLSTKLHISISNDDKKLKDAEILLRHTAFRLNEMLHSTSYEDRPLVQETLAQVNKAESDAMMHVFNK